MLVQQGLMSCHCVSAAGINVISCFIGGCPVTRIITYSTGKGDYRSVRDPQVHGRLSLADLEKICI